MPSSGYTAISFTAGEQPTTAKWNLVGSNDASFNTGNGFNDAILQTRHFASGSVTPPSVALGVGSNLIEGTGGIITTTSTSYVSIPTANYVGGVAPSFTMPVANGTFLIFGHAFIQGGANVVADLFVRVVMDGAASAYGAAGHFTTSPNTYNGSNVPIVDIFTGVSAASHTFNVQYRTSSASNSANLLPAEVRLFVIPLYS